MKLAKMECTSAKSFDRTTAILFSLGQPVFSALALRFTCHFGNDKMSQPTQQNGYDMAAILCDPSGTSQFPSEAPLSRPAACSLLSCAMALALA